MNGVVKFGKKGILIPHYVDPYGLLPRVGKVAYELIIPIELASVHLVSMCSCLKSASVIPSPLFPLRD